MHKHQQTSPICSHLALFDKRFVGTRNSTGLPVTVEPMAPMQHLTKVASESNSEKSIKGRDSQSDQKGAVVPVCKTQVHLTSPLFVVPKGGGGWHPLIDLRKLN